MATNFTPLLKQFSWTNSTIDTTGAPLPAGEALSSTTLGIRADGDTTHGPGNYQWMVVVAAPATSETVAQLDAALSATPLKVGNYWAAALQTNILNGVSVSSAWSAEVPFDVPPATPAAPAGLSAS